MKKDHLEKIFAFLLVLTMQTVYMKLYNSVLDLILSGLLIVVVGMLVIKKGMLKLSSMLEKQIGFACVLFAAVPLCHLFFLWSVGINFSALFLISVMCTVLFSLCVVFFCSDRATILRFLDDLTDAVCGITAVSLFFYFTGQVLHWIQPTNQVTIQWGGVREADSYFYLMFTTQASSNYHSFQNGRFTGVFAEAPMCAFMLCIALLIVLFVSERKISYFRIGILGIAIYATVSTTGYIIAVTAVVVRLILLKSKNRFVRIMQILSSVLWVAFLAVAVIVMYRTKLLTDVASVSIRNSNMASALRAFASSPIYGYGFKSDRLGITGGDTSVFSQVLQQGGILFAVWYFGPMIGSLVHFIREKAWNYVAAIGLYFVMLYVTAVTYTGLSVTAVALFFAVTVRGKKRKNERMDPCDRSRIRSGTIS